MRCDRLNLVGNSFRIFFESKYAIFASEVLVPLQVVGNIHRPGPVREELVSFKQQHDQYWGLMTGQMEVFIEVTNVCSLNLTSDRPTSTIQEPVQDFRLSCEIEVGQDVRAASVHVFLSLSSFSGRFTYWF